METDKRIPDRLYKYREFNNQTLDMIVSDNLYYADPGAFNDPLDSRPSLDKDLDDVELAKILRILVEQRSTEEMRGGAKALGAKGQKTMEHIKRRSRGEAVRRIADIEYYATEPDFDPDEHERFLLGHHIQEELLRRYERGIVALAEQDDCPLMWSHYGEQHRGICIGYSVPADAAGDVHRIEYGGSRLVQASAVAAMLAGNDVARRQVDEAVLLRKAENWGYEQEWRLLGHRGLQSSPVELEEVVFGLKCKAASKYIAMKVLEGRERPVKFYETREEFGTFKLRKVELTYDEELFVNFPRRHLSILEPFEPLSRNS